ncbi:hypothetical protein ABBQ38_012064 [Trebouxia sp. C0009 RCD-2024]
MCADCNPAHADDMASSDWSSLAPQTLDQVITLLSQEAVVSNSVLPEDKSLFSVHVVCRHWRNQARQSIAHLPLTQGKDLQLGMLLQRFKKLESLHVRFKALTASSIESLQELPALCQLDVTVDNFTTKQTRRWLSQCLH